MVFMQTHFIFFFYFGLFSVYDVGHSTNILHRTEDILFPTYYDQLIEFSIQ